MNQHSLYDNTPYNSENAWKNLDQRERQNLNAIGMKQPSNQDYIHNVENLLSRHLLKKELETIQKQINFGSRPKFSGSVDLRLNRLNLRKID